IPRRAAGPHPPSRPRSNFRGTPSPARTAASFAHPAAEGPLERAPTLRGHVHVAAGHHALGDAQETVRREPFGPLATPRERRYVLGRRGGSVHVRARAHDGAGREHRPDRGLGVVTEERAQVLAAGLDALTRDLE